MRLDVSAPEEKVSYRGHLIRYLIDDEKYISRCILCEEEYERESVDAEHLRYIFCMSMCDNFSEGCTYAAPRVVKSIENRVYADAGSMVGQPTSVAQSNLVNKFKDLNVTIKSQKDLNSSGP